MTFIFFPSQQHHQHRNEEHEEYKYFLKNQFHSLFTHFMNNLNQIAT